MAERNSKTCFTREEANRLADLVRDRERANSKEQKKIRNKIRKIGLYWSEVANGEEYTVANLEALFKRRILTIVDEEKKPEPQSSQNNDLENK